MADSKRAQYESVVGLLAPPLDERVFVGGCTIGLFTTDSAAGDIRPTREVDAIVDIPSYSKCLPTQFKDAGSRRRRIAEDGVLQDRPCCGPKCLVANARPEPDLR